MQNRPFQIPAAGALLALASLAAPVVEVGSVPPGKSGFNLFNPATKVIRPDCDGHFGVASPESP